jgi:carboxypeptidase T
MLRLALAASLRAGLAALVLAPALLAAASQEPAPSVQLREPAPSAQLWEPPAGDGPWVVRARFHEREQVNRLASWSEPWEVHYDQGYLIVDVNRSGWQRLVTLGFEPELDVERTARYFAPQVRLPGQLNAIPGFPCYRTVEETYASAQGIVAAYPTLATWIDVGDTWEKQQAGGLPGYDMMVLRLTNSAIPGPKPKLLVTSAIHAREYATAELMMRFAEFLSSSYGTDPDVTWILDNEEIHLLLQTNPDGRKKAEAGALWRKNTDSANCASSTEWGIDLNRNFPYNWGCCGGSSGSGCDETYRGTSGGSEPETQAVRDYMLSIFPDYGDPQTGPIPDDAAGLFIDVHSYSELVLWPWGYTGTQAPAPNNTEMQTLGRKFAYFNHYMPEQSIDLYITDGTTIDYAYGQLGVAAYTFEVGTDFFQDCGTFQNAILPDNQKALLYAARIARQPYRLPAGPDALGVATVPSGNVGSGQPLLVTATLDDTHYNNTNGTEPVQIIAAGEVYVDTPPWAAGAVPFAMAATDGTFDHTSEAAQATLATGSWAPGRHTLFVRGQDAAGNWGPVGAVFIDLTVPVELQGFGIQ